MADEFIDFYQALDLPLEADRGQVRSRIAEVYLEAQRNLDHRDFKTRIKYQELFEVILPRARFILLDDARRDEYDGLVRAFRGVPLPAPALPTPLSPAPPVSSAPDTRDTSSDSLPGTPVFGRGDVSGFRLEEEQPAAQGRAPRVQGLPSPDVDPARLAQERDEMLQKWRARLEAAIQRDEQEQATAKPSPGGANETDGATNNARPRAPRAATAPVSFNFGNNGSSGEELDEETKQKQAAYALELKRTERKREAVKEILMGVGVKATIMGGMGAAFPLGGLLIFLMGHFYPRDAAPKIALPSSVAWFLGLSLVAAASFVAAHYLSKAMRHKKAFELSAMPLEDILRQMGRSY